MAELIGKILNLITKIAVGLVPIITLALWFAEWFFDTITELATDALDALTDFDMPFTAFDWNGLGLKLEVINTFIPLVENTIAAGVFLSGSTVVLVVRWVKSFVPTIAN